MEDRIARLIALTLAFIGLSLIAVIPYTRATLAQDRSDRERAAAPLLSVPLENLAQQRELTFDVIIPSDPQWKRISDRFGTPTFLLVAASAKGETRSSRFPSAAVGLSASVWRNRQPVALTPTTDVPDGYSAGTTTNGYEFRASAGDGLQVSASIQGTTVPPGSLLLLAPQWSTVSPSASAEGANLAALRRTVLAAGSALLGIVFVWWAVTMLWGRPSSAG